MTKDDYSQVIKADDYITERKKPTAHEEMLYLKEVNFRCPKCGTTLKSHKQRKSNKLYEIAHIYPNSPTFEQYTVLAGLPRLGANSESFENKIALCKNCHDEQDYHTSQADYLQLLGKKQELLRRTILNEISDELSLEDAIADVCHKIQSLCDEDFASLNYRPVPIAKKFARNENLLKSKVSSYVLNFYPFIRELFRNMEGQDGFNSEAISIQIKCCFIKMAAQTSNKEEIFAAMVSWLQSKTLCESIPACEAIISYFIQNCEVFYEIT